MTWQRSKGQQLRTLEKQSIAQADATALTSQSIVDFIRMRRRAGVAPSTAGNDLIWLRVVLRAAKSVRGVPVQPEVVDEARVACRELRLIAKSKRRERPLARPNYSKREIFPVIAARDRMC